MQGKNQSSCWKRWDYPATHIVSDVEFAEGYIPFSITCGTLPRYQILLAFTEAVSVTGVTLVLSAGCKSQTAAPVTSAAVYIFQVLRPAPETSPLFRVIVLLTLYHAQSVSLMSAVQGSRQVMWSSTLIGKMRVKFKTGMQIDIDG